MRTLEAVYPDTDNILLMGDFNLPYSNPAYRGLRQYAHPLVTKGASTLSSKDGYFSNLYDNVWADDEAAITIRNGVILPYPSLLGITHLEARKTISDHAPIIFELN